MGVGRRIPGLGNQDDATVNRNLKQNGVSMTGQDTAPGAGPGLRRVVAHRGLSGLCPESTLPAFAAAVAICNWNTAKMGADRLTLMIIEQFGCCKDNLHT